MVYKVCKGGVRSGNTLRGLRTLQSKRYARQACVIGRSSLGTKDVSQLLESSTDDSLIQETLGSTNVILSLNKKQRWRIPATVSHMIKTGCFDQKKTQVSLLERHKLKRRANCVSFVCNRGRYGQVVPKQKRYFSFNLSSLGDEQSKRYLKRERAEALKKAMASVDKKVKQTNTKTVNVFTVDGVENGIIHSNKSEYRLEVFYPCPQSCSLTFNPKYTDVVMEMNVEGNMEIRSNTNKSKKKRKHRKRFTNKDVQEFQDDVADDGDGDFWYAADEREFKLAVTEDVDVEHRENLSEIQWVDRNGIDSSKNCFSENIFADLIAEAMKAKSIFGSSKGHQDKKSSQRSSVTPEVPRSHIVYTNEKNPRDDVKRQQAPAPVKKGPNFILYKSRTILTTAESSPEHLKEKFGSRYSEASCTPRRFVINVTEDIVNMISAPTLNTKTGSASYLVFIYDGFYDYGLDTFKVALNSQVCYNTKRIAEAVPFNISSIGEIVKIVISTLLDMKQENQLNLPAVKISYEKKTSNINFIQERMKVSVEALSTSDQMSRLNLEEKQRPSEQFEIITKDLDQDLFCEICYDDVNVSHHESASGLGINECGHNFCDNCLQIHFRTHLNNGRIKMTCPGYQCDSEVGLVTLMTVLHVEEVSQILQRQTEEELEGSQKAKWCPNPNCGRIIKVISGEISQGVALDVMCQCGNTVCFSCLSSPHWPARCEQAENYTQSLSTLTAPTETLQEETDKKSSLTQQDKNAFVVVEGRLCPGCGKFLEKDGGCNHMMCKCGLSFCWNCMNPMTVHDHGPCQADPKRLTRLSRRLLVKHVAINNSLFSQESPERVKKPRQKATMYQKAMKQRMNSRRLTSNKHFKNLATNIDRAAYKDLLFKRQILSVSGADQSILNFSDDDLLPVSVAPHMMRLLQDCHEFKLALHRVSEFTFVLLQDSPPSIERRRALKLANDMGDYCSFIDSILEMGSIKDPRAAVKRLLDIKEWAKRALDILLVTVEKLHG